MEPFLRSLNFDQSGTTSHTITFFEKIFANIVSKPAQQKFRRLNLEKVRQKLLAPAFALSAEQCGLAEAMLREAGFHETESDPGVLWLRDGADVAAASRNFQEHVTLQRVLYLSTQGPDATSSGSPVQPAGAASTSSASLPAEQKSSTTSSTPQNHPKKRPRSALLPSESDALRSSSSSSSSESSPASKKQAVTRDCPPPESLSREMSSSLLCARKWSVGDRVRVWWCPKQCAGAACFCDERDAKQYAATVSSIAGTKIEVIYDKTDEWPEATSDEFEYDDMKLRKMTAKDELLIGEWGSTAASCSADASAGGHGSASASSRRSSKAADNEKFRANFEHLATRAGSTSSSSAAGRGRQSGRSPSPVRGVRRRPSSKLPKSRRSAAELKRVLREAGVQKYEHNKRQRKAKDADVGSSSGSASPTQCKPVVDASAAGKARKSGRASCADAAHRAQKSLQKT